MRIGGAGYQTIADELGYSSRGAANQDVTRALERRVIEQHTNADVLLHLTGSRLDALLAT